MVTFCGHCGTSLPLADITFRTGQEITSPDFRCTECGEFASEHPHDDGKMLPELAADAIIDLVVKDGEELLEKPSEPGEG
ncbi:MAG: hypothetical protein HYZ53_12125 [Planctomycetes bacterium]|nr:hypothetical protein [Planctomycetota bacterium]